MSATFRRLSRVTFCFLTFSVSLASGGVAAAQLGQGRDDDMLDLVRRREKVEMQRVEAEIRLSMNEARRISKSAPGRAVEILKGALSQLEKDTILPKERREELKRLLNDKIHSVEAAAAHLAARTNQQPKQTSPTKQKSPELPKTTDREDAKKSLGTIKDLEKDGKLEEAGREGSHFAERYPADPAAQASSRLTLDAAELLKAKKLKKERERNVVGAFRDLESSATAPGGDMEFPKDWKERTKGRSAAVPLTAKEKAIIRALGTTVSVSFKDTKLEDVINYLQTQTGQPILLDKEALKDVEASYDSPVTLNIKGVSLRTVLRRILADLGLTYVVREEAIQVTSAQRARDMMVTRRYYVGDLLASMTPSPIGPANAASYTPVIGASPVIGAAGLPIIPIVSRWNGVGAFANQQAQNLQAQQNAEQMKQTIEQLRDMIVNSVDSQTWREHGGGGTITFHAPTMSFLIRQSAEVHALLGGDPLK
jgi:TolA-binding protein